MNDSELERKVVSLRAAGMTWTKIGREIGMCRTVFYKWLASLEEAVGEWTPKLPPPSKVYGYPSWSEKDGPIPTYDIGDEERRKARARQMARDAANKDPQ